MSEYYGVITNREFIKLNGKKIPFYEFLDVQPDGWLISLAYAGKGLNYPRGVKKFWDCGAWSYKDEELPKLGKNFVTPEWAYLKYCELADSGDMVIAPDHMLIPGKNIEFRRKFNLESAIRFYEITKESPYYPTVTIHGMDLKERINSAIFLKSLGYKHFALGGMAARACSKNEVINIARTIRNEIPDVWIHVLGLSSPEYAAKWDEIGIDSFDGSSHFKQAFLGGAFYFMENGRMVKYQAVKPEEVVPDTIPVCDCKACTLLREQGIETRKFGSGETNIGRAAHNMNILLQAHKAYRGLQ